jgi:5'-nucleotidase
MKKVVYVSMDGVLVKEPSKEYEELKRTKMNRRGRKDDSPDPKEHPVHWTDVPEIYADLEPMENAIESFNKLSEDYDMYVVSTVPWANLTAWVDKRKWIEKHLPIATKKLIFTHNKELLLGDFLIDDRLKNGTDRFTGKVIHFGQSPFENWHKVMNFLDEKIVLV